MAKIKEKNIIKICNDFEEFFGELYKDMPEGERAEKLSTVLMTVYGQKPASMGQLLGPERAYLEKLGLYIRAHPWQPDVWIFGLEKKDVNKAIRQIKNYKELQLRPKSHDRKMGILYGYHPEAIEQFLTAKERTPLDFLDEMQKRIPPEKLADMNSRTLVKDLEASELWTILADIPMGPARPTKDYVNYIEKKWEEIGSASGDRQAAEAAKQRLMRAHLVKLAKSVSEAENASASQKEYAKKILKIFGWWIS